MLNGDVLIQIPHGNLKVSGTAVDKVSVEFGIKKSSLGIQAMTCSGSESRVTIRVSFVPNVRPHEYAEALVTVLRTFVKSSFNRFDVNLTSGERTLFAGDLAVCKAVALDDRERAINTLCEAIEELQRKRITAQPPAGCFG